ncbi:MAG: hypothetical protein NZ700_13025 [Gemmataceae bacterium]|nr:hypothetical protein [Gemmataceae bacterium]MDW8266253.1 DUF6677 family protein [Gemmataceae bacterium]
MSNTTPTNAPKAVKDLRAAVLSYLVPGLGQIVQGRVGKGLMFLLCLYGLFFYGMALGSWRNVYLPNRGVLDRNNPYNLPKPLAALYNRFQFAGQFWIGVAAWPAIWQFSDLPRDWARDWPFISSFQAQPDEQELNRLQAEGDKRWDLGWVCTVIAGALNVLVIYDAYAGPLSATQKAAVAAPEEKAAV